MPAPTPIRLTADHAAQELTIGWSDDHTSVLSFEGLRRACPCVTCRGGHAQMGEPIDPMIFLLPSLQTHTIEELRPAGNYGLQIRWGDGHNTGIYRWAYLREIDPALNTGGPTVD
ncbi:MAG: DUF971 domain-containing protein [Bacteroidota bacterium]